jgi:SAM-dependent methyltransferase
LWRTNASHSKLTDWGLGHISIANHGTILDVGCGGGRTVNKLAAIATQGKVYGVDYSEESVAFTKRTNARWIEAGRVEIRQASVSQLPFPDNSFDVITAVETHYFWPDLPADLREVLRVLKAGGTFVLIAEVYKGANTTAAKLLEKYPELIGMTLLTPEEHRGLLTNAGYSNVQVIEESANGWICGIGRKPISDPLTVSEYPTARKMDRTFARITPALSLRGGVSAPGLQLSNRSAAERRACSESHETTKHQERHDIIARRRRSIGGET